MILGRIPSLVKKRHASPKPVGAGHSKTLSVSLAKGPGLLASLGTRETESEKG